MTEPYTFTISPKDANPIMKEWRERMDVVGNSIDDLNDVREWLRREGQYDKADRIRTIMARLANSIPWQFADRDESGQYYTLRDVARSWDADR